MHIHILKFNDLPLRRLNILQLFPAFGTIWRQQPSEGNNLPRPCWAFAGLAYVDELSAEDQFATSQPLEVEQFLILCVLAVMVYLFVDRRYLSIEALLQGPSLADFVMASCFTYTLRWAQNGMKGYFPSFIYRHFVHGNVFCPATPNHRQAWKKQPLEGSAQEWKSGPRVVPCDKLEALLYEFDSPSGSSW